MKPIPPQVVNERAAYGPFDLKNFIQVAEGSEHATFRGELESGEPLPQGLICTSDGILTGIPAKDTHGVYQLLITAENAEGAIEARFVFTVKPSVLTGTNEYMDQLKSQVWEALGSNLPIPDLGELYDRPITLQEIYYLLERWGTLTIWDALNLDDPGEKHLLQLEGTSPHYHIYDRGSCLVVTPIDLFSHERTLEDGLQTARVAIAEVYKRDWTIQMTGFDKFIRAAWIEAQHLIDKHGRRLEVINFNPSPEEVRLYANQAEHKRME
jgi:hypothetical protein